MAMSLTEFADICSMQSDTLQAVYKRINVMADEHYRYSLKVIPMISNMELMSEPVIKYAGFLFEYRQYIISNMIAAPTLITDNTTVMQQFLDFLNSLILTVDNMIRVIDMSIAFKDAYKDTVAKYPRLRIFDRRLIIDLMWLFSPEHMQIFNSILNDCTLDRVKTEAGRLEYMYSMIDKLKTKRF